MTDAAEAFLSATGPMVIVNLPSRADRRAEFAQQLARIGLGYDHPKVRLFQAVRPDDAGGFPSIGARGCFLSHLGIYAETGDSVLICEDDLDFVPDFLARVPGVTEALAKQDWDFFYGGYGEPPEGDPVAPGLVRLPPDYGPSCTHFYAVRGRALEQLVPYLKAMMARPSGHDDGGPMHVDGALAWFRRAHPEYVTLAAVPELGVQRPSRTDIHALRWFDRVPVIRDLAGLLRRARKG